MKPNPPTGNALDAPTTNVVDDELIPVDPRDTQLGVATAPLLPPARRPAAGVGRRRWHVRLDGQRDIVGRYHVVDPIEPVGAPLRHVVAKMHDQTVAWR